MQGDEYAPVGRAYPRRGHNTSSAYFQSLMYVVLRISGTLHKKHSSRGTRGSPLRCVDNGASHRWSSALLGREELEPRPDLDLREPHRLGFETSKQITTLNAGSIVVIGTFLSDIFPHKHGTLAVGLPIKLLIAAAFAFFRILSRFAANVGLQHGSNGHVPRTISCGPT
jgi:hypothetical protein